MNARSTRSRMCRFIPILAAASVVALVAGPKTARADQETYQKTLKSTCWILRFMPNGVMSGSGVLVDRERRLVISNQHVVGDEREVAVFFPQMKDGEVITDRNWYIDNRTKVGLLGRVVSRDRMRDVSIIQLPSLPEGVQQIEFATKKVTPGMEVQSIGNPVASQVLWIYTSGTVRAVYRKHYRTDAGEHEFNAIETQSPINPGDSGGPLVNSEGQLIGISQGLSLTARLLSFSVAISEIQGIMAEDWRPAPMPIDMLLEKVGVKFTRLTQGPLSVEMPVVGSKPQPVFIGNELEVFGKAELRKIWTLALTSKGAPNPEILMAILQQNGQTKMGGWTVEKNKDGEYLLMFCLQIDATAPADAVKSAMEYVTQITVAMNKQLSGAPAVANNAPAAPQQAPAEKKDAASAPANQSQQ